MSIYQKNLEAVLEKIEKVKNEEQHVTLVAISKTVTNDIIKVMYEAGQKEFGENRVQAITSKADELKAFDIAWHFVGRLQTNKINHLINLSPTLWHSCDSYERAYEYNKRLHVKNKTQDTLLQINSANEDVKAGVAPNKALETYLKIQEECKNINLKGVMSIGAFVDDKKTIHKSFETTYKLYEQLHQHGATICSMGMSNDFELAIQSGSNMVRIGSVLFQ